MKKVKYLLLMVLAGILTGCIHDGEGGREKVMYMVNEPVFMSAKEFRSSLQVTDVPRPIETRGKMCLYNGFLYISEPEVGVHIIDNRNPASPKSVGFIELLGNVDLAVRNNTLYADAYVDLVWFDLADPARPEYVNRLEEIFKHAWPCIDNEFNPDYVMCNERQVGKEIIVGWKTAKRVEWVDKYPTDIAMNEGWFSNSGSPSSGGSMSKSVNGSMSRFGLYDNYLYCVMRNYLTVFDITSSEPRKAIDEIYVGMEVETIFPYKNCLFMGTPMGMTIYSVENPLAPERMSTIWHVFGCDPVVVEDDIAYVTIHSGNMCGQNNNDLIIYDVSDVTSPQHIVSYAMKHPKGLGIDDGTLFLCDDGLQIFKVGDPQQLMANRLVHYSGMDGYDVIPYNNVLMMIADDGLHQYDYSDLENIHKLSQLPIGK